MSLDADQLSQALYERGYKLTAPRRAVLGVVAAMCQSLSPAEIYARAHRRYPRLGLVTVYRTLDILVEAGVLLDVFVAVFVMGIMIFHINREFDHIDTDRLSSLKD